ncbi:oligosaccharide flippase family protein [Vibrio sp. 10N.247.311.12]|uniref:oligosaccharide flippase family protein n=1 Tax=Vibrio sp. 10N.247.311.12 TaxID=3229991 RepID=UPI00354CA8E8
MNLSVVTFGLAVFIPQIFTFLTVFLLSENLSVVDYGKISLIETYQMLIQAVVSISIEKGVTRYYKEMGESIVEIALRLSIKISFLLYLPLTFIPYYFGFWNIDFLTYSIVYFSSVSFSMLTICQIRNQYQSKPIKYLFASLLKTVPLFFSVLMFVVLFSVGYESYIYSLCISSVIIFAYIALSYSKSGGEISNQEVYRIIRYSIPFVPTVLSAWVLTWSNRIFLGKYVAEYDLGVYSLVIKYASVYFLLFQGLSIYFTPRYYTTLNKRRFLDDAFYEQLLMIVCSFIFLIPVYYVIRVYLNVWLEIPIEDFNYILLISLGVSFISATTTLGVGLTMNFLEKTKQQMLIYVSIAGIATGMNYIFIESYGIKGALAVLLVSHILLMSVSLSYLYLNKVSCKVLVLSKYMVISLLFVLLVCFFYE